jgi:ATP-binding protein involved in chromosome partitioning
MTNSQLQTAARTAVDGFRLPYIDRTLGELAAVQSLQVEGGKLHVQLRLPVPVGGYAAALEDALGSWLQTQEVALVPVLTLTAAIGSHAVQKPLRPMPGIANIIAVGSAKGGVGKSTVAANLAIALAAQGARTGLLDADMYGPSQPLMMGLVGQRPETVDNKSIMPLEAHGVKVMSLGFLIDPDKAAIWRGPMVTQALTQLLNDTLWGELDYLVVDLPPGTGDLQLTLAQKVPVAGAVVVTTPQEIAVADARKGIRMFETVQVPLLGVVENMSTHHCSQCGHEDAIFGDGGGARLAQECNTVLLAKLPLDTRIRVEADSGAPTAASAADSARGRAYFELARRTAGVLAQRPRDRSGAFPAVVVERTK